MGNFILRWLKPSPAGPIDRATYRLRLVLAVQIAAFGLAGFLVLSIGMSVSPLLMLPELVAHVLLGLLLWTNRVTLAPVLAVAGLGVADAAMGDRNAIELLLVFFIIPLVLPFYRNTAVALTTQILVWVMVAGAGLGIMATAADRMPWTSLVAQLGAIGLVGTLMVIFRFSLLRLIGANQRLENTLAQYRGLYENGSHATLVLGTQGNIREVYGSAGQLLGAEPADMVGRHYTTVPAWAGGKQDVVEAHLRNGFSKGLHGAWVESRGPNGLHLTIHLASATGEQQAQGVVLVVDIYADEVPAAPEGL